MHWLYEPASDHRPVPVPGQEPDDQDDMQQNMFQQEGAFGPDDDEAAEDGGYGHFVVDAADFPELQTDVDPDKEHIPPPGVYICWHVYQWVLTKTETVGCFRVDSFVRVLTWCSGVWSWTACMLWCCVYVLPLAYRLAS